MEVDMQMQEEKEGEREEGGDSMEIEKEQNQSEGVERGGEGEGSSDSVRVESRDEEEVQVAKTYSNKFKKFATLVASWIPKEGEGSIKRKIVEKGSKVNQNLSKKTNVLIIDKDEDVDDKPSAKIRNAKLKKIQIISVEWLKVSCDESRPLSETPYILWSSGNYS